MHKALAKLVFAAVLCMAHGQDAGATPASSPAFEAMLEQAEQVRSSDPAQFQALLGQLTASLGAASPEQREQLEYLKAYHLAFTGRFDLGIASAKRLFETTSNVQLKFRAGSLIVNGYAATREFSEGLRYLDQTLSLIDDIDDPELRHHGWSAAGVIHNQVGQFEQGQYFAELMLADTPSPRTQCFAGALRLESLYSLGRLRGEEAAIEALMRQCTEVGEEVAANFARAQLARLMADKGESTAAIALLNEHLDEIEATRYPRLIGEIHSLLAELNLANDFNAEAEFHAKTAIDRSVGIIHSLPLVAAYRVMYESARKRGDMAAALEHHIKFAEADKAYLDSVKARELAYQMVRHETQQKTQTIELLNKQNEVLRLEQQVSAKTTQANRLLIALLAVLLASIAYWALKIKKMQLRFRHLAQTDALTGISNRHHFTARATAALEASQKAGQDVGLVMLDLDNFKAINDQYGHAVGDWALKQVALVCQEACRRTDLVGRLGGEEFAFLLIGSDLGGSTALAQDCRRRIAAIETSPTGHHFPITASFGVAGSRDCGHGFEALLARADDALYRSKREGRDRVSVHAPGTETGATT